LQDAAVLIPFLSLTLALRHTYAALLTARGENPKFIQVQMGHSSMNLTMDTYGHLIPEVATGVSWRLDETVFGGVRRLLADVPHRHLPERKKPSNLKRFKGLW